MKKFETTNYHQQPSFIQSNPSHYSSVQNVRQQSSQQRPSGLPMQQQHPLSRHSRQGSPLLNESLHHNKSFNASSGSNQPSYRGQEQKRTHSKKKHSTTGGFQKNMKFKELSQQLIPKSRQIPNNTLQENRNSYNSQDKLHVQNLKAPMIATGSNLSTMRNANMHHMPPSQQKHSPSTVKMGTQFYQNQSIASPNNQRIERQDTETGIENYNNQKAYADVLANQDLNIVDGPLIQVGTAAYSDFSNKGNFSCFILRSNEKQQTNRLNGSSSKQAQKENLLMNSSFFKQPTNFGQRLEEIEADAKALKRSMLENSSLIVSGNQLDHSTSALDEKNLRKKYKQCKKNLHKTNSKYQQLIKEHASLQHDYSLKDMQVQRLNKEVQDLKEECSSSHNKIKQLRYENDRLFNECTTLKNIQTMISSQTTNSQTQSNNNNTKSQTFQDAYQLLELESENYRKKVKRLTGELEVLETYFDSFATILKQNIPVQSLSAVNKVVRSLQDSIDYMKDLFTNTKLNVTQGKRVQRKIRYEKLKTEFQQLIIQLTQSSTIIEERQERHDRHERKSEKKTRRDHAQNDDLKEQVENLQIQIESMKLDHTKKIEQYKEQVQRMRENIDLFKDNMKILKEQNEELQSKVNLSNNTNQNQQQDNQQIQILLNGLKEDNERLAEELKRMQEENFSLQSFLGVNKETILQQNGIINNLQTVIDNLQKQVQLSSAKEQTKSENQFFTTARYSGTGIASNIIENSSKCLTQHLERSKSCNSSVEQQRQKQKIKPCYLHQSMVLNSSRRPGIHNYSTYQDNQILMEESNHMSTDYYTQSQQFPHQLNRSQSNLSQQSYQLQQRQNMIVQQQQQQQLQTNQSNPNLIISSQGLISEREQLNVQQVPRCSSQLNISQTYHSNALNKTSNGLINDSSILMGGQDQSYCFHDSFIKYLVAEQKLNGTKCLPDESQLDQSNQAIPQHINGLLEACASPKTARFSSLQNRQSKNILNTSNISRDNIKHNTKSLLGEIQDVDEEIAALQGTLFSAFHNQQMMTQENVLDQQQQEKTNNILRTIDFDFNAANDFSLLNE